MREFLTLGMGRGNRNPGRTCWTPWVKEMGGKVQWDPGGESLQNRVPKRWQLHREETAEICGGFYSRKQYSTDLHMHVEKRPEARKELSQIIKGNSTQYSHRTGNTWSCPRAHWWSVHLFKFFFFFILESFYCYIFRFTYPFFWTVYYWYAAKL